LAFGKSKRRKENSHRTGGESKEEEKSYHSTEANPERRTDEKSAQNVRTPSPAFE
jgi:hypothetical protein